MIQKVNCHDGKCWEEKKGRQSFEDLFEEGNIVQNINRDLWKKNFYGGR